LADPSRPLPALQNQNFSTLPVYRVAYWSFVPGCYAYFGLTLATLKYCVFGFLILGLIFTDAETKLLPDKLTLPGLALGIIFSLLVPVNDVASQFLPGMVNLPFSADISARLLSLLDSLLGAALGASFIYGAGAAYLRWRGMEGMGFGDVKLMAMVGAFLGIKLTIFTIFAASLAGSLFGLNHRADGLDQAHPASRDGWPTCKPRAAGDGNPRKWFTAITRCPSASFWAAWPCSHSLSATNFCTGTGGFGGKAARQSGAAACPPGFVCGGMRIRIPYLADAPLAQRIAAEADLDSAAPPTLEALPVHLYNTVIQQLKQQKHELQVQTLSEQRRARTSENFSQTVLTNLPCGVLVFGLNGLVKQANPAAKDILGFRSLSGMSATDIFREAAVCSPNRQRCIPMARRTRRRSSWRK
jgi:PAS domain-containing protein